MPKRTHKTLRQSEDEIRDAEICTAREAENASRKAKFLSEDEIRVHLDTGPLDFSDEDQDNLDDLEIEESNDEEEEEEEGLEEIKEVDLPPALIEKVGTHHSIRNLSF